MPRDLPYTDRKSQSGHDGGHWLLGWMRENHIRSGKEVDGFLHSPNVGQIVEYAGAAIQARQPLQDSCDALGVAGPSFDLSPRDCLNPAHNLELARPNLMAAWLYFDSIVVQGLQPARLLQLLRVPVLQPLAMSMLGGYMKQLLYLERQGALRHLIFRPRTDGLDAYQRFGAAFAEGLGLNLCLAALLSNPDIDDLQARGTLAPAGTSGELYTFTHPKLTHEWPIAVGEKKRPEMKDVALTVYVNRYGGLLGAAAEAQGLQAPMISAPDPVLSPRGGLLDGAPENLLLQLDLPFMSGVTIERLLHLRSEYADEFGAFRTALAAAAADELSGTGSPSDTTLSDRVRDQYILPALADIDRRLRTARRAMSTKVAQSATIGLMTTGIGLATRLPMLTSAGIAGTAASITHFNKLVDEQRDIRLSDMYFLWRVRQSAGGDR
jgi:hypothetical protein